MIFHHSSQHRLRLSAPWAIDGCLAGSAPLASFEGLAPPKPTNLRAEATVMDVNRQAWTAKANILLHPAAAYVGVKPMRAFFERRKPNWVPS